MDGFIAGRDDTSEQPLGDGGGALFEWLTSGDTPSRHDSRFHMSRPSADFFDAGTEQVGAVIAGRRTYEVSRAWGGAGPLPGRPLFVLTHHIPQQVPPGDPSYTFVTDGIESAVEQATKAAGDKTVAVMGARTVQQCLRAGLLDELTIHLVPVVLGAGVRLLDNLDPETISLE